MKRKMILPMLSTISGTAIALAFTFGALMPQTAMGEEKPV